MRTCHELSYSTRRECGRQCIWLCSCCTRNAFEKLELLLDLITPPATSRDWWFHQSSNLKKLSVATCSLVLLPEIPDANFGIQVR